MVVSDCWHYDLYDMSGTYTSTVAIMLAGITESCIRIFDKKNIVVII